MQDRAPDFYLGSREHRGDFQKARACFRVGEIPTEDAARFTLIEIDPPVIGQPFGMGGEDIHRLLLRPRPGWPADLTSPIKTFTPVYVYRLLRRDLNSGVPLKAADVMLVAWCELYPSLEEAEAAGGANRH